MVPLILSTRILQPLSLVESIPSPSYKHRRSPPSFKLESRTRIVGCMDSHSVSSPWLFQLFLPLSLLKCLRRPPPLLPCESPFTFFLTCQVLEGPNNPHPWSTIQKETCHLHLSRVRWTHSSTWQQPRSPLVDGYAHPPSPSSSTPFPSPHILKRESERGGPDLPCPIFLLP